MGQSSGEVRSYSVLWAQFPLALTRDLPHCWGVKVGPSLPLPKVSPVLKAFVPVTMSQG